MTENEIQVSVELLRNALDYLGNDAQALVKELELDPSTLADPDGRVPLTVMNRFWTRAPLYRGDPDFGPGLGEHLANLRNHGHPLTMILPLAPNFGSLLEKMMRYHDLLSEEAGFQWVDGHEEVRIVVRRKYPGPGLHAVSMECMFTTIVLLTRRLFAQDLNPRSVCFAHAGRESPALRRVFGNAASFDQVEYELVYAREDLIRPNAQSHPRLLAHLEEFADKLLGELRDSSFGGKVKEAILKSLPGEPPRVEDIARALGIGLRTLQSKLQDEGESFQTILNDARRSVAEALMSRPETPLVEIAMILGFSDQSAFNRAFKKWTGESPGEFRETRRSK